MLFGVPSACTRGFALSKGIGIGIRYSRWISASASVSVSSVSGIRKPTSVPRVLSFRAGCQLDLNAVSVACALSSASVRWVPWLDLLPEAMSVPRPGSAPAKVRSRAGVRWAPRGGERGERRRRGRGRAVPPVAPEPQRQLRPSSASRRSLRPLLYPLLTTRPPLRRRPLPALTPRGGAGFLQGLKPRNTGCGRKRSLQPEESQGPQPGKIPAGGTWEAWGGLMEREGQGEANATGPTTSHHRRRRSRTGLVPAKRTKRQTVAEVTPGGSAMACRLKIPVPPPGPRPQRLQASPHPRSRPSCPWQPPSFSAPEGARKMSLCHSLR